MRRLQRPQNTLVVGHRFGDRPLMLRSKTALRLPRTSERCCRRSQLSGNGRQSRLLVQPRLLEYGSVLLFSGRVFCLRLGPDLLEHGDVLLTALLQTRLEAVRLGRLLLLEASKRRSVV